MDWRNENQAYKGNARGTINFTDVVETFPPGEAQNDGSKVPLSKRRAKRRKQRKAAKRK